VDQFFRIEKGEGKVAINGEEKEIEAEFAVVVPAGARHNIINSGKEQMKLYTIYSPAHHKDGTVHKTKKEAMEDEEDHV
jgi:mannose-6-phosphate isomerase-like protein (cupin superfamily)